MFPYIRVSSTTFTQSAQKSTELGEITQQLGLLRRSRSFKITELRTNRKLICDFLLVINTNLISSCLAPFPRYSLGKVQNRYIWLLHFGLTARRLAADLLTTEQILPACFSMGATLSSLVVTVWQNKHTTFREDI